MRPQTLSECICAYHCVLEKTNVLSSGREERHKTFPALQELTVGRFCVVWFSDVETNSDSLQCPLTVLTSSFEGQTNLVSLL